MSSKLSVDLITIFITVEGSFSQIKLITTKLRNHIGEKSLSTEAVATKWVVERVLRFGNIIISMAFHY